MLPGALHSSFSLLGNFRLAGHILPPGATPVLAQYWFWFGFRCCIPFPYSHLYSTNPVLISCSIKSPTIHYHLLNYYTQNFTFTIISPKILSNTKPLGISILYTLDTSQTSKLFQNTTDTTQLINALSYSIVNKPKFIH